MDDETEQMWASLQRRRFLAIGAAAAMLGLVGCGDKKKKKTKNPGTLLVTGTDKVEKRMKKNIPDKTRRKQALALLDKMRGKIRAMSDLVDDSRDARGLLPPERQTREELLKVIVEYDDKMRAELHAAAEIAVEMRKYVTASEWPLVFTDPQASKKKRAA